MLGLLLKRVVPLWERRLIHLLVRRERRRGGGLEVLSGVRAVRGGIVDVIGGVCEGRGRHRRGVGLRLGVGLLHLRSGGRVRLLGRLDRLGVRLLLGGAILLGGIVGELKGCGRFRRGCGLLSVVTSRSRLAVAAILRNFGLLGVFLGGDSRLALLRGRLSLRFRSGGLGPRPSRLPAQAPRHARTYRHGRQTEEQSLAPHVRHAWPPRARQ